MCNEKVEKASIFTEEKTYIKLNWVRLYKWNKWNKITKEMGIGVG